MKPTPRGETTTLAKGPPRSAGKEAGAAALRARADLAELPGPEGQVAGPAGDGSAFSAALPRPPEEAQALFAATLAELASRVSLFVRRGFFEPLVPLGWDEQGLTLLAPTAFHRDWVRDHYLEELEAAAAHLTGQRVAITLVHDAALAAVHHGQVPRRELPPPPPPPPGTSLASPTGISPARLPPAHPSLRESSRERPRAAVPSSTPGGRPAPAPGGAGLSPRYTFETFVEGPSNHMALAACRAVAEAPAQRYSPLFLFGKTGLGKTHLLHAIGHEAQRRDPTLRVLYMSAEQWVNEYIQAIRAQRFDDFRKRYRGGCDLLLIDDVQFLAGKDSSQDEFFHTFNSLHDSRRQIVVTGDRYPHEIEGLEQRLQTRLGWGLIADIQAPEMETRVAILERKAESLGLALPAEVVHFLADHIQTSVRALEGALVRLSAYAQVTKTRISLASAKEYLRPVMARRDDLNIDRISQVVAGYFDVKPDDLKGKSRQRRLTQARQLAMYLARKHLQASLPEIGRFFRRDHTTVLSSVRKVAGLYATDASTQAVVTRLERDLL